MLVSVITPYLEVCFETCLLLKYHPSSFKHAITVMIPKGGKPPSLPGSWRPLALLSCTSKVFETVIENRLQELVTRFKLLPKTQYGLSGKPTTMALQYFLNPIYSAWTRNPKRYASLLSIDFKDAYDRVNHRSSSRYSKILAYLMASVDSCLIPELPCHCVETSRPEAEKVLDPHRHSSGQPSFAYLVPLLHRPDALHDLGRDLEGRETYKFELVKFYAFAYIDDTYNMVASPSYEENVKALNFVRDLILEWADAVGATFSTGKYHLMHFKPSWSCEEDYKLPVDIQGHNTENEPATEIKMLGVIVDHRLQWTGHVTKIAARVKLLVFRLGRLSNFISGPSLDAMVQLYITKIRATITYVCPAWLCYGDYQDLDCCLSGLDNIQWHMENDQVKPLWGFNEANIEKLERLQSFRSQKASGALKKIPRIMFETELAVEDIKTVLVRLVTAHRARILNSPEHDMLEEVRNDLDEGRQKVEVVSPPIRTLQ
ncbi:hypothetical protein FGADI_10011 [Fusarium gaditjirri]|uniref:Reverse transcriptase domain-containing protein n=1 Tax=Fusarium gaditjirri TaxID=282569 RepID=A0A8H4WS53_9HYPO|nr:hypothetical protein FGADI_10011 [Fusarium gaditjirri]